ncbi:hypothetical protein D9M71_351750 [compost metagenome]
MTSMTRSAITQPGSTTAKTIDSAPVHRKTPWAAHGQHQHAAHDAEVFQELGHVGAALRVDHVPERVAQQRRAQHEQGEQEGQRPGVEAENQQDADDELHEHGNGRCQHGGRGAQRGHVADRAFEAGQLAPAGQDEQDHQQHAGNQDNDVALTIEQGVAHGGVPVDGYKLHSSSCAKDCWRAAKRRRKGAFSKKFGASGGTRTRKAHADRF